MRILHVEDNPHDAELTLKALNRKGQAGKVTWFQDGIEALDRLLGNGLCARPFASDCPKVIFLDLKLPGLGGLEVLRRLKSDERTHLIPVVILTSSQEESDIQQSYELGANSFIVKPVDYDKFSRAVGEMGEYWLSMNKGPG